MMFCWINPQFLTNDQLLLIAESLNAAPDYERLEGRELLLKLLQSEAHAFTFGEGNIIILERRRGKDESARVNVVALAGDLTARTMLELASFCKNVAAEWGCDAIETTTYDPRIARAIVKLGGRIESQNLILPVGD